MLVLGTRLVGVGLALALALVAACGSEHGGNAGAGGKGDGATGTIEIGDPDSIGDGYTLEAARIIGDQLEVEVTFGGGCEEHEFELFWDGSVLESLPPQVDLVLTHDANNDFCEAFLSRQLTFDLGPVTEIAGDEPLIINLQGGPSLTFDPSAAPAVAVKLGDPESTGDGYSVEEFRADTDGLVIVVSYGGGCEEHEFELFWDGGLLESLPPQANLTLVHDGNHDFCEAFLTEELRFGLGALQSVVGEGPIKLNLSNGGSLTLE